tara:strand:- start:441 stop:620 length:180 start_codon:yes stop_codon:yes gene_type:complete
MKRPAASATGRFCLSLFRESPNGVPEVRAASRAGSNGAALDERIGPKTGSDFRADASIQ